MSSFRSVPCAGQLGRSSGLSRGLWLALLVAMLSLCTAPVALAQERPGCASSAVPLLFAPSMYEALLPEAATEGDPAERKSGPALGRAFPASCATGIFSGRTANDRLPWVSFRPEVLQMLHDAVRGAELHFQGPGADYAGIVRELRLLNPFYGTAAGEHAGGSTDSDAPQDAEGEERFVLARKVGRFLLSNKLSDGLVSMTRSATRVVGSSNMNLLSSFCDTIVSHSYEDGDTLCLKLDMYRPSCQGFLSDIERLDDRDFEDLHPELVIQFTY